MANWKLKINISKEIQELKNFCKDFPESYIYEGSNENTYIELAKALERKFQEHENQIREVTEDDGTFEDLETNLEDLVMSYDIENSNYNMENIYQICDCGGIWLEQRDKLNK